MSPDEDGEIVGAARGGDRAALDRLLRSHQPRLYAVCRRITGNDADAADACQETLITIVRRLDTFDGRSRFATWAYRVAVNASLDELRRRKRRPAPQDTLPDQAGGHTQEGAAVRLDVDAALRKLPPEFRAAVVLRDLCSLDYAEIAEVLDIPPGTVRSRISRGRAALAPILGNPTEGDDRPIASPQ